MKIQHYFGILRATVLHAKCCRTARVRFLLNSAGKGCGDYDGDFEESSQCPHALDRLCSKKFYAGTEREWQKEFTAEKVHVIVLVAIATADVSKGIQSRIC